MSIFKSTLKPFVAAQLKAREKVIGQVENDKAGIGVRDNTFLRYTTGKNGWVRMVSMVNYNSQVFNKNEGTFVNDGRYNDSQLSKKYVLEGGTLYEGDKGFYLRKGINQKDGIYGSNIDKISSDPKSNKLDRTYGIRPMPGITSVSIQNKTAYGSLREATINFFAWDKHQLEELEVLFMRPGYSVYLDWGWSQYLDHGPAQQNINSYPDNIRIENSKLPPLNLFQDIDENALYNSIDSAIEKSNGNYDAMIGYVKNFSWQLLSNGGWQCSTTIISRGEALEEIKASNNPRTIIGSKIPESLNTQSNPGSDPTSHPVSFFERLFLTIKGALNNSEFSDLGNPPPPIASTPSEEDKKESIQTPPQGPNAEFYDQKIDSESVINKINDEFQFIIQGLREKTDKYKVYTVNQNNVAGVYDLNGYDVNVFPGGVLPAEGSTDGSGIEYISFNIFVAILQRFFIPRNENTKEPILHLIIPGTTPCLMSEDSVSIDPTTCLIYNPYAKFITGLPEGFSPELYTKLTWDEKNQRLQPGQKIQLPSYPADNLVKSKKVTIKNKKDNSKKEVEQQIVNVGEIGNIYISIGKIIQIYRDLSDSNGINVIDLLNNLLESISFALGGINDFKLYTEKNTVQIIDTKYLETGEPASSKFKMDLMGLKSICRDVKINSKIFPEQSSMMAIAAAAGNNSSSNLGDLYNSTQNLLNKGLKDRVIRDLGFDDGNKITSSIFTNQDLYYFQIYENINTLEKYIKHKVLGIEDTKTREYNSISTPPEEEISNAGNLLKTMHYQINGKDVDFKALIPFELEITLDGISGCVVGQIFTIDKSILPRDYYNKNVGFVITGISHMLQNNDWTTTLKTQICLLENENYTVEIDKLSLKQNVESLRVQSQARGYIFYAMVDYIIYLLIRIMADDGAEKSKTLFEAGTKAVVLGEGMDVKFFDPVEIQAALYKLSNNSFPGNYGYSANKGYIDGGLEEYMIKWWETNKTNTSLPNFPTGSYKEFTQIILPTGTPVPSTIMPTFLINFERYLLDIPNASDPILSPNLKIKSGEEEEVKKNFFLYKFFESDPKKFFEKNFITTRTITTDKVAGMASTETVKEITTQSIIDLKKVWVYLLGKVQKYIDNTNQFSFIIQGNASPLTSLEVDINGDGQYILSKD